VKLPRNGNWQGAKRSAIGSMAMERAGDANSNQLNPSVAEALEPPNTGCKGSGFCADHEARHRPTRLRPRYLHTARRVAPHSGGCEASIFHHEDGVRVSWFDNDTRVVGLTAFKSLYRPGDILVLPEDLGQALRSFPGPKVIFNQNIYYGYMALGEASLEQYPYQDTGLLGIITVSSHNGDNLTYAFPE